jgi:hypothetical protein
MANIVIHHPDPNKPVHPFFVAFGRARKGLTPLVGQLINLNQAGTSFTGKLLIPPPNWAIAFQGLPAGNKDQWQLRVWKLFMPWTLRTVNINGIAPNVLPDISPSYPQDNDQPCPTFTAYGTKITAVSITYLDMKNSSGQNTHGQLQSGLGNTNWAAQFDTIPNSGNAYSLRWTGTDGGTQVTDGLLSSNLNVKASCP